MRQVFKIFTLCVLTLGWVWQTPLVQAQQKTLLVMGDSLSAGYGMSLAQAWPALLQTQLNQVLGEHQWQVINASVSGETTQGGVRRLPGLLAQYQPQWVLLELGANDGLRGYPIAKMTANLSRMIVQSQTAGAKVAVLGIQLPPNYGARYTGPFFHQYAHLAQQHNTALVPFILEDIAIHPHLMQADGLHPTQAAQTLILDNVWQHLSVHWTN
ncbi:MAG: arylesterase [Oceanospirillaceae bacterium]|jgi:acyl-CoA thioesterase-1|nr:arylesterase [Oceanospirillaceae bacterium]MBT4443903.1 arylesterase [Oceanospirillaceae bacterium]MBT6078351.1 arylesterase [Oceanospirillaceae bacterium]MBT7331386.1 arylesterase [Oceanospirillaceae bacterium]